MRDPLGALHRLEMEAFGANALMTLLAAEHPTELQQLRAQHLDVKVHTVVQTKIHRAVSTASRNNDVGVDRAGFRRWSYGEDGQP